MNWYKEEKRKIRKEIIFLKKWEYYAKRLNFDCMIIFKKEVYAHKI